MIKFWLRKILPQSFFYWYHRGFSAMAAFWFRYPSEKLVVIGVTGTNGKSTVVSMIGQLLEAAGETVGWTSTATLKIANREWLNDQKMTMLGRFKTQALLRQMVNAGCRYAVVETSSQGIVQHRHQDIHYDVAVLTNLTPEHIEAHGGFENYKNAKKMLFAHTAQSAHKVIGGKRIAKVFVVNGEVPQAQEFLDFPADKKIAFLIDDDIEVTGTGSTFQALGREMQLSMLGRFNVGNALAAISVVKELGVSVELIAQTLPSLRGVPGRLERIDVGQPFTVIVDYAPDPDSMEKLYQVTTLIPHQRIIHVFGSAGGGRDVSRRPMLGRIAGGQADICIVTNEDPYDDDPQLIIDQVAAGAREQGKQDGVSLFCIRDRKEAIERACAIAQPGDLVLLTGKACEQGIMLAQGKMMPWDDRTEIKRALSHL